MNIWTLKVTGMSCGGCATKVKRAVASLDPTAQVTVDLERGHVQVHTMRQQDEIEAKVLSLGYGVAPASE
ncbi:heavy-metal-associated domain-containing protein [Cupriavidus sp. 8B]